MSSSPNGLLDLPPFPAERYAPLADRLKVLLATRNDVVFVQAEAILALEATATSLARPGLVALNIVTSPYGSYFGGWLRREGATVHEVTAEAGQAIDIAAVTAALDQLPQVDLVAVVHAETSSGILNPLPAIAAAVRIRGALLVVDAVASVGGHDLSVDDLGIDVCVVGPQKALAGPAGLSVVSISVRAWQGMATNVSLKPDVPSSLALLDLKTNWLDAGRGAVPGMPSALEFWALDAALERVETEELASVVARHRRAARATRAGLLALGVQPWVKDENQVSFLATAASVPPAVDPAKLIATARELGAVVSPGFGAVRDRLIRLDHTGQRANLPAVLANVIACGTALVRLGVGLDVGAVSRAIAREYLD